MSFKLREGMVNSVHWHPEAAWPILVLSVSPVAGMATTGEGYLVILRKVVTMA